MNQKRTMAQGDTQQQKTGAASHVVSKRDVHVRTGANAVAAKPSDKKPSDKKPSDKSALPKAAPSEEASEPSQASVPERNVPREAKPKKRRIWLRVLLALVGLIVIAALVFAGLFAWNRWWRYDDVVDFQGTWYAAGTTVPMSITADRLVFDAETSYSYTIDPQAKTIRYTLANLEGKGRYWFDYDRQALVLVDGDGFTAQSTAVDDLKRLIGRWIAQVGGSAPGLPEGEGVIVLMREPDPEALAAEQAAAQAAAAAQAEAEAKAARQEAEEAAEAAGAAETAEADEAAKSAEASDTGKASAEGDASHSSSSSSKSSEGSKQPDEKEFANESVGIFE